jgi:excisionase family DNA binding protein
MDDRWLSVDEIVEYLGVSRDTVYGWIAERGLPAHRVGRLWKFKKDAVDSWIKGGGADARRAVGDPKKAKPVGRMR